MLSLWLTATVGHKLVLMMNRLVQRHASIRSGNQRDGMAEWPGNEIGVVAFLIEQPVPECSNSLRIVDKVENGP